ncbi:MAG: ATP-binding protein, partial [Rubrivivax sp.]
MASLVTLVMSDIVGSTRRWAADEVAMAADLEQHDRILGEAVGEAGGTLVKHTGDGMLAVFDDPVSAASAAVAIQHRVGAASWRHADGLRVRVAVHAGVVFRRDGDVFGTAVNRVARVLEGCPAGAVLLSGAASSLLAERAPAGLSVRPVGEVALAGFSAPEPIHTLTGPGLAEVQAVEVRPRSQRRGGELPPIHDDLVGRAELLGALWEALGRSRLVSLVGVGGMGKTRLALEVAAGAAESLPDGAWWIDLSVATSAQAVLPVALAAVGAREMPGRTALQALVDRLSGVKALVVLDNCEHVMGAVTPVVEALRAGAPELTLLCTSREALGLRGEKVLPLGSLGAAEGQRLFLERALAVRPDLDVQAQQAAVQAICARLDGIPLALELAAARCRSMSPGEIAQRLDDRFKLLRGGRTGAERHRTLHAAVSWSHALLQPEERAVFEQMAVFAGGALIDALAALSGLDEFDALDIVDRLIARSMVVAVATPLGTRYQQLETLRQFAEDRLVEAGAVEEVRARHLAWALALAQQLQAARGLQAEAQAFRRFAAELENLRVAVAHARANGHHHVSHQIVAAISNLAFSLPAWAVRDWVRPVMLEGEWTDEAARCEIFGGAADMNLGNQALPIRSLDELPEWYGKVSRHTRIRFASLQLHLGCEEPLLHGLLATCKPESDLEEVGWQQTLLWADAYRKMAGDTDAQRLAETVARGEATAALARKCSAVYGLGNVLIAYSVAVGHLEPARALKAAQEAMDLSERVGAAYLADLAEVARGWVHLQAEPSLEQIKLTRDQARQALKHHQLRTAGGRMLSMSGVIAR